LVLRFCFVLTSLASLLDLPFYLSLTFPPPRLPLHCRCTAAALPLHCRCTAAALPLHCRCTAAALPLHYNNNNKTLFNEGLH
jgi:hypothetical protein